MNPKQPDAQLSLHEPLQQEPSLFHEPLQHSSCEQLLECHPEQLPSSSLPPPPRTILATSLWILQFMHLAMCTQVPSILV